MGSREARRFPMSLVVEARWAGERLQVRLHDISATGARLETRAACLLASDWLQLELPVAGAVTVEVMWSDATHAGGRFAEPLPDRFVAGILASLETE